MRTRIFVVLFVFLLATVSPTFAGDLKPFKGWAKQESWNSINPEDYPELQEILGQNESWYGFVVGQLLTGHGQSNVGGTFTWESPQLVYYYSTGSEGDDPLMAVIIGYLTYTFANGDKIFMELQGVWYQGADINIAASNILEGTGRFEGATGSIIGVNGLQGNQPALILEGTIETVGNAKKE